MRKRAGNQKKERKKEMKRESEIRHVKYMKFECHPPISPIVVAWCCECMKFRPLLYFSILPIYLHFERVSLENFDIIGVN